MVVTSSIMRWYEPFDIAYRGATFVHDWTAIATWLVVARPHHDRVADPRSLRGMVTGRVSAPGPAPPPARAAETAGAAAGTTGACHSPGTTATGTPPRQPPRRPGRCR
jgi:hypothetical protein